MAFDPQALIARTVETRSTWQVRDTQLYALGVGATELPVVYEQGLQALPTMAAVLGYPGFSFWGDPALGIDQRRLLHAETEVELHAGGLPVSGEVIGRNRVTRVFDLGADKGAMVYQQRDVLVDGAHVATVRNTTMLRGNGGQGGETGERPRPRPIPERAADATVSLPTAPNQALLYRLSGDLNPLHIDPAVAKAGGFAGPILHGLCSFGFAGRAIVQALCGNEPARLHRIGLRFSSPVYPGETLVTEIWHKGAGRATFRTTVAERGVVVLNNGFAEYANG